MILGILTILWRRFWPMRGFKNSSDGDASNQQRLSSNPTQQKVGTETLITDGFEEYSALNEKLLHLIISGRGDSKETDIIRNEMDRRWYKMSAVQQDAIRKMNERFLG